MRKLLLSLLLIPSLSFATFVDWIFVKVVDGDTIALINPALPDELKKISVRVLGIDTPESTYLAKCEKEQQLGIKAKEFVTELVKGKNLKVNVKGWDKYGGRVLGDVFVNNVSLRDTLILKGYARPYDGGTKSNWCN